MAGYDRIFFDPPVTVMSEFLPEHSAGEDLPQSDRLRILSPEEYELLWGFPRFTQSDRDLFFTLTVPERGAVEQCRSVRTKIHLLLHLGYFRARQRFFRFELPAVRRAIAYAHGGRFRVRSQHEQEVWNECARLVGNAVVYYNALILSEALTELELRGDLAPAEVLKRVSPVAWQHINFYGRYQFDEDFTPIDLDRIRQQLSSEEVSRLYATANR